MSYYCGLDIGSTYTKIVITSDTDICFREIFRTETGFNDKIEHVINRFSSNHGVPIENIRRRGVTGYGRKNYLKADFTTTEIKAVARSISFRDPAAGTVLDIGGQDYKVVHLNNKGSVCEFHISDKCASGTGRFIEMLALRLNLTLEELSEIDLTGAINLGLSSTCAVFADAEVIRLIAEGKQLPDIVYSVYLTVIRRLLSSFSRNPEPVVLTGGIVKNRSFVTVLKKFLPALSIHGISEIACAYGIALLAYENDREK